MSEEKLNDLIRKTKEEYEKGLKEGKWIEYPPRQDTILSEPKFTCGNCSERYKLYNYAMLEYETLIIDTKTNNFVKYSKLLEIINHSDISEFVKKLEKCKCGIPSHEYKVNKIIEEYQEKLQ